MDSEMQTVRASTVNAGCIFASRNLQRKASIMQFASCVTYLLTRSRSRELFIILNIL